MCVSKKQVSLAVVLVASDGFRRMNSIFSSMEVGIEEV